MSFTGILTEIETHSNKFSYFSYHTALLLINSNIWSIELATIVSNLLCSDNDHYFRQKVEIICRSSNEYNVQTSSKLSIEILSTLLKKKKQIHYQLITSASTSGLFAQKYKS
ncbi:unnamed protein product [Rotaria sp. Silwood2]|nr:unnamed protein product [Rotaria sp. Silwood2]CAF4323420.1 unnamed protein product [Rotaria sp. Silwood2]